eukprot:748923-Hanusia_phi.AAC.4
MKAGDMVSQAYRNEAASRGHVQKNGIGSFNRKKSSEKGYNADADTLWSLKPKENLYLEYDEEIAKIKKSGRLESALCFVDNSCHLDSEQMATESKHVVHKKHSGDNSELRATIFMVLLSLQFGLQVVPVTDVGAVSRRASRALSLVPSVTLAGRWRDEGRGGKGKSEGEDTLEEKGEEEELRKEGGIQGEEGRERITLKQRTEIFEFD